MKVPKLLNTVGVTVLALSSGLFLAPQCIAQTGAAGNAATVPSNNAAQNNGANASATGANNGTNHTGVAANPGAAVAGPNGAATGGMGANPPVVNQNGNYNNTRGGSGYGLWGLVGLIGLFGFWRGSSVPHKTTYPAPDDVSRPRP